MSSTSQPLHPQEFHSPGWDYEARTPVVDGKYYDRKTGELRTASGPSYSGPPDVDIIIQNLHQDTNNRLYRAARPFPVEILLFGIMKIVNERELRLDSLTATAYAIRVIVAHEMTVAEWDGVVDEMANGIWKQE
ncbi:uncharacterized protein APUU_51375S [Aspergillus puulaauensis]|uniref:Uncharacterized protein n=1 Tax=Aspergillus puulaauensis TaxID=1220207 RepID=A0A7R8AP32_9EURO|nr:uncharacterized protein APUU_51375S [Aspergillus puulaauensis]BCS26664.1 hypothetical protein APUU_51375S [Aspergillus puulaauensis]